jgi:(2Fe-2S) ferredoxin
MVCQHRSCERNYSPDVLTALQAIAPPGVLIASSGCLGQCGSGPTVQVMPDQTWYCRVKPEDASEIVESHLKGDRPVRRLLHPRFHPDEAIAFTPLSSDSDVTDAPAP